MSEELKPGGRTLAELKELAKKPLPLDIIDVLVIRNALLPLIERIEELEAHCYDVESGEVYLRLKQQCEALKQENDNRRWAVYRVEQALAVPEPHDDWGDVECRDYFVEHLTRLREQHEADAKRIQELEWCIREMEYALERRDRAVRQARALLDERSLQEVDNV